MDSADTKVRRPRGRPKVSSDESKRDMIVATAREVFIELGFANTTTAAVAARCKISKQTLYRLFESKGDLFRAVVVSHRQLMIDLPRPDGEDLAVGEALEKIFLIDIDEEAERQRSEFIRLVMRESEQFPELAEMLHKDGRMQSHQQLADWLGQQANAGKIAIDDTLSGARMLMDMIFGGMAPMSGDSAVWPDWPSRTRHLKRCIAIFSRGVGAQR